MSANINNSFKFNQQNSICFGNVTVKPYFGKKQKLKTGTFYGIF